MGKRIRHINRYRDIALAFTRHGFGFLVEDLDLLKISSVPSKIRFFAKGVERKSIGERIRLMFQELGPTFIKLGQIASTRADLVPESILEELVKLQDQVAPFPFEQVRDIVRSELGMELEQLYSYFGETPLAAASIGQVHEAVLRTGERVAVKVQRPHITVNVRTDLEILQNLGQLAESRFEWARRYQLRKMIQEFGKSLLQELDYTIEGRNTETIGKQFEKDPFVRVPRVYKELTTKKLLTLEFLDGIKLSHIEKLQADGYDVKKIGERLMKAMLQQILVDGFFHADPHPGNLQVLPGGVLALMDFGMVGRLTPAMKRHFANLVIALMRQSTPAVMKAVLGMGLVTHDVDVAELERDVDNLRDKYVGIPFSQMSLAEAVSDLLDVANRHQVRIPPDFILLGKSLMTVEGVVQQLDPEISVLRIAEPFGLRLLKDRFHPRNMATRFQEELSEYGDLALKLPKYVKDLMKVVRKGRVEISLFDLDRLMARIDLISGRLMFGIVLLSFSILMSGIIIGTSLQRQSGILWNIPVLEIGTLIAIFLLVWLLFAYAVMRSGKKPFD
ncbi:ABC1 kinase family protein [Paenibacillus silviterrae]|uniref:ABC1 kinase family protein n=1 Tax=Paenibacillus silviterrae TaxID=3242194 RepID=UPI002543BC9A|nr:AarF/ABC1/UbiB kinase family protein [Paenibacillus chinjuensis]